MIFKNQKRLACITLIALFLFVGCQENTSFVTTSTSTQATISTTTPQTITDLVFPSPSTLPLNFENKEIANMVSLLECSQTPLEDLVTYDFEEYHTWIQNMDCNDEDSIYEFHKKFPIQYAQMISNYDSYLSYFVVTKLQKEGSQPFYAYQLFEIVDRSVNPHWKGWLPYYCSKGLSLSDVDGIQIGDSLEKVLQIEPASILFDREISRISSDNRIDLLTSRGVLQLSFTQNDQGEWIVKQLYFENYLSWARDQLGAWTGWMAGVNVSVPILP